MTFKDLGIVEPILKALEAKGYTNPTPIQEESIPILLKGKDLLGCAQTGTGKTAAFAIPILQQLYLAPKPKGHRKIKALVVTPTRELALQISENFYAYAKHTRLRNTVIYGGVKQSHQVNALRRGIDILVATPGRLLDLINQGFISLADVEHFVLDEADQMLDMGFIHDIRRIIAYLKDERQSLFFSATMPPDIRKLFKTILHSDHEKVTIQPEQATAERVEQAIYFVNKSDKTRLLIHLLDTENMDSTLVFSRTKHGANKIVRKLENAGIRAAAIHGNKSQAARQKALGSFKDGRINVLVATDIAARGIDVDKLSHVVNFDLPNIPETYVHRIGRTGRAGMSGIALSFCNAEEKAYLRDIQRLISQDIPVIDDHAFHDITIAAIPLAKAKAPSKQGGNNRGGRNRNGGGGRNQRNGGGGNHRQGQGGGRNSRSTGGSGHSRKRRPKPSKPSSRGPSNN